MAEIKKETTKQGMVNGAQKVNTASVVETAVKEAQSTTPKATAKPATPKTAPKAAAKPATPKTAPKAAAKPAAKKAATKPATSKTKKIETACTEEVFVQYGAQEVNVAMVVSQVKATLKDELKGGSISVYIKPEDARAYYVYGDNTGSIEL